MKLPICLTPTCLRTSQYHQLLRLQECWHRLLFSIICKDSDFISELGRLGEEDPLLKLQHEVCLLPIKAPLQMMFVRMDYLWSAIEERWALVELNTFALVQTATAGYIARLHDSLPNDQPMEDLVSLLHLGVTTYEETFQQVNTTVLMLMEDENDLNPDAQAVSEAIRHKGMNLIVSSLPNASLKLKGDALFCDDSEVSVVYCRIGYRWEHVSGYEDRFKMLHQGRSVHLWSPISFVFHLKHFQQLLYTDKSILERNLTCEDADTLRSCFQEMLPVNEGTIALVSQDPDSWVMKPNRGGGGNNHFGKDILHSLPENKKAWSLQRMIKPSSHATKVQRLGQSPQPCQVIPEVSIYGSMVWQGNSLLKDHPSGYLVRSKPEGVLECGINAGNGFLDSIRLLPD